MFSNNMSPADIGAIMGNQNDGWGNSSWLWFIVIIFALFGGWGNGGWGGNAGTADNYVLASDFATLQRQIDSATDRLASQGNQIANGLSSLGYDQLNQMNGINTNILTNSNAIQTEIANCCCSNKSAIADVNYNIATQANGLNNTISSGFCQTNFNAQSNTRDIIDSQNTNTRAILDAIQQNKVDALQDKINEQNQQIQALNLAASQAVQNNTIIGALRPSPIPAYITSNPYCSCGNAYGYYGTTVS